MHLAIRSLAEYLGCLAPGPVEDTNTLAMHLADARRQLRGSRNKGMHADKVYRLESPEWNPQVLNFKIERHGGAALGSTRAEVQQWEVNVKSGSAEYVCSTHRQLHAMSPRWSAQPLAAELAEAIRNGTDHAKLNWRKKGTVALTGDAVPYGFSQTVAGRKKRLKAAIAKELGDDWHEKVWRDPK